MSRRTLLKLAATAELGAVLAPSVAAQPRAPRPDWPPGSWRTSSAWLAPAEAMPGTTWREAHLTPTYAVIGCYRLLGHRAAGQGAAGRVRPHPSPGAAQEARTGAPRFRVPADPESPLARRRCHVVPHPGPQLDAPAALPPAVRAGQQPRLPVRTRGVHLPRTPRPAPDDLAPEFIAYLDTRRRANGSFNNTPAADGSDGHVTNTWWGLEALATLGRGRSRPRRPSPGSAAASARTEASPTSRARAVGAAPNVYYTWAAVRALKQLGAEPGDREACVRYLGSLANADGGCGDRPGWASNPLATYQALDALDTLGAPRPPSPRASRSAGGATPLPAGLKVFTIQIEAHGQGSPREAVALAQGLRIHLWGAKNARPEWLARAQAIADGQGVPVRFFVANEEYGTWVRVPGLGTYSHTSDIIAPAGADFGPSLANQGVVSWPDYRARRLAPLQAAGGRLVWQFGENEELVRIYLDDSLERGGYAAISTFHFGNPDFTNTEPFLGGYRGQIPFVALQDAHGAEPWWFADMTEGFRTLFLAREPTWDGWLEALRQQLGRRRPPRRRERVRDLDARRLERGGRLRPPPRARLAVVG